MVEVAPEEVLRCVAQEFAIQATPPAATQTATAPAMLETEGRFVAQARVAQTDCVCLWVAASSTRIVLRVANGVGKLQLLAQTR